MIPCPIERAAEVYNREHCGNTFPQDLALLLKYGYVISTPRLFMMGRPIMKDATHEQIYDLTYQFDKPDTWLCHVAAGTSVGDLVKAMPHYLPYVAFERRNRLRVHSTARLML